MNRQEFTKLIDNILKKSSVDNKKIAAKLNIPYSTLMRECNPWDTGAKLDVVTAFKVMDACGDFSPLKELASEYGLQIIEK